MRSTRISWNDRGVDGPPSTPVDGELELLFDAALRSGDVDQIDRCLSACPAAVNRVLPDGSTPLNVVIGCGRFDVARALVDRRGADVHLPDSFRVDGCRRRPVHYACAVGGSLELVRTFVEVLGVDVDETDEGGATPLHHAAAAGHIDIVEYLVSVDCDINAASNSGRTALWKAAQSGHREIVQLLFALGARIDVANRVGETPIFECSRRPELIGVLGDLLQFGADPTARDIEGNTALHMAAGTGNVPAAERLVDAGIDVGATNDYGNCALHSAVVHGQTAMLVFLLNSGADASATNHSGQSPLYIALLHHRPSCVQLLLDAGCHLSVQETHTFDRLEATRNASKRALFNWSLRLASTPASLSHCCRVVVRRHLANGRATTMSDGVSALPLPERLRLFLLLDEFT